MFLKRTVDVPDLSTQALKKIIGAQAIRIDHQKEELNRLVSIHNMDAKSTTAIAAFRFFIKCLFTKK